MRPSVPSKDDPDEQLFGPSWRVVSFGLGFQEREVRHELVGDLFGRPAGCKESRAVSRAVCSNAANHHLPFLCDRSGSQFDVGSTLVRFSEQVQRRAVVPDVV